MAHVEGLGLGLGLTLTYQNLLLCRFPINSIFVLIIGLHKKVGFGRFATELH